MNKEQIEKLAKEAYPERFLNMPDIEGLTKIDTNKRDRKIYIEGLKKASELLYSKRDIDKAIAYGIILEY